MSSAILYLAIIAIWAVFLVPAWIRRPHAFPARSEAEPEERTQADGDYAVEYLTDTESDVEVSLEADFHVEVSRHEHEYGDQAPGYASAHYAAGIGRTANADYVADGDYAANVGYANDAGEVGGADLRQPAPRPSQSREQMLRARRRMLSILGSMTLVTAGFAMLGLVKWWICVPPAGMLVLYVLLLREIAMADAELARKRAAWEAREARQRAWEAEAEQEAYEASLAGAGFGAGAGAGAQIIDISGRVTDQLYDQYADAAVRAVGD